jgi:hypothetical protein
MEKKYLERWQVAAALKIAAQGVEVSDADGLTLSETYSRLDDAFRVVIGRKTFDEAYIAYIEDDDDDEVDDPETPKF